MLERKQREKYSTTTLFSLGPAELLTSPKSLNLSEDEPATFTCTFKAMEPPITHVTWLKEGEPTRDVNLRYKVQRKSDSSSLVFKSVNANDKGRYACEITTKGYPPIKSEFAMLSIREKLKFSPEPVDRKLELNSTARVIIDNHKNEKLYKKSI